MNTSCPKQLKDTIVETVMALSELYSVGARFDQKWLDGFYESQDELHDLERDISDELFEMLELLANIEDHATSAEELCATLAKTDLRYHHRAEKLINRGLIELVLEQKTRIIDGAHEARFTTLISQISQDLKVIQARQQDLRETYPEIASEQMEQVPDTRQAVVG